MPFHVATARQRMQLAVRDAVFELPAGYTAQLPEALAAALRPPTSAPRARATCGPSDAVTVAVTTAEQAQAPRSRRRRRRADRRRSRRVLMRRALLAVAVVGGCSKDAPPAPPPPRTDDADHG